MGCCITRASQHVTTKNSAQIWCFQIVRRAADQELQDICEEGDTEPESPETPSHCLHQGGTCASASTCQAFCLSLTRASHSKLAQLQSWSVTPVLKYCSWQQTTVMRWCFQILHPLEDVEHNCTSNVVGSAHPVLMLYLISAHCAHQSSPLL